MARKLVTDISAWPSLTLEGNLIAPAMIASIDRRQAPEQTEADYRIRKGLTIRDEISTAFRVGQAHLDVFAKLQNPSAEATRRFVRDFLAETFGFNDLDQADGAVAFLAGGRVPIVVVPPAEDKLDRRSPTLSTDRSRSPAFVLQDYLNDSDAALWGLVTNGAVIRLMRDNASLTRPAYIEADLAAIFTNEDAASFAVLWSLIHRTRFGAAGTPATDCVLERWRDAGAREGEVARDRLAGQVKVALRVLGSGFLDANPDLAVRLRSGELNLMEWFNELLRLVYRLIFLMVAEDRNLLHPDTAKPEARKLYVEGYSLAALRVQSVRAASRDKHHDRFEAIKVIFRALAHGQHALGLPALGGLFAADMLPHLETARLRNRAFMEALYRLSWLSERTGVVPVNWRAMETEELGSVYESLLELQPQLGDDGKTLRFASEMAEQKGNQRKTTGSYYTPDSLVQALLDTALDPVLDKTEAEATDPVAALLKLSVIDPACGSGHFLLAAARRIATRVARIRTEGAPSLADFRHALRDVARNCLHGVDRNPMAVELTKVALWIETVDPGLPLGFFDAQIRCGDALLGVFDLKVLEAGIPDAAYKPLTGDDKDVAKYYGQKNRREQAEKGRVAEGFGFNRARDLLRDFEALRAMPENTVEQIEAKVAGLKALTVQGASAWQLETACDLYVAAFLLPRWKAGPHAGPDGLPRRGAEMVPTSGALWEWLRGVSPFGPMFGVAIDASRTARAFHWPLEFPDVMQRGGFDVVLGNPPWEVMQLSEKEYFAASYPEIAGLTGAARKRAIDGLRDKDPASYSRFMVEKRNFDSGNEFAREAGRFNLTARGKINTYALFAELFAKLTSSSGRSGAVLPTGIATDATTGPFFEYICSRRRIYSLHDFQTGMGFFDRIGHARFKFCLLTLVAAGSAPEAIQFSFFSRTLQDFQDSRRHFSLTKEDIEHINPNTRTAPVLRSEIDAHLTASICAIGTPLIREENGKELSPFSVMVIQNFFTSSNPKDSLMFEKFMGMSGEKNLLPVKRGGSIWHFDHRFDSPDDVKNLREDWRGNDRFVPDQEVNARLLEKNWNRHWLIGWRDITNATNERTIVASILPIVAADDTLSLLLPQVEDPALAGVLLANLNSLVLDYVAQSKVGGTHIRKNVIAQFPVLAPSFYTEPRLVFLTPKVLELTYTSHCLVPFARDLGYDGPPFAWDEDRRALLRADLDAFYARAYSLTRDELRYILDPADVKGLDYPAETFRVLKDKEIRQFGEYRTRRLALEAWDRMEADGTFVNLGFGAGQIATAVPINQRPTVAALPGGAWMRAAQQPNDAGTALAAILKTIDGPKPSRTIRLAAAMILEPHLLTPLLPEARAREWLSLVGQEAEPRMGNVVGFAARANQGWGTAVSNHRGNGRLIENLSAGTWAPGPGLNAFDTTGWPDGRAGFVLGALAALDLNATVISMPDEVRGWITHAAAG
ncbi:N-6 DNA methylase [Nitrospirillum amazonense]|uniref:Eco57I restriction-modification methylase domain-containing protein n=1 Tax=Nitrospirillum amazonense TaxID=28077 RepID=UPI002DD43221|nr:N-6 DNA methylase [Nitrospirillum amazonense]MEC4595105.1 N-6 DNA methylase [Nitrospirillum amazonense]